MDTSIPPQPGLPQPRLSKRQRQIVEELVKQEAGEVADLYKAAITLLELPTLPGVAYLVGHACREICGALPRWLGGTIADSSRVEYVQRFDRLLPQWEDAAGRVSLGGESVPVPVALFRELDGLFQDHKRTREVKARQQVAAMHGKLGGGRSVTGTQASDPAVKQWIRLRDDSVRLAHLREKGEPPPSPDDCRRVVQLLDEILWNRLGSPPFYAGMEVLDEIVDEANE